MINQTNHLNHLIDPTFIKVNRLFVLLFESEEDSTSFSKYYVPKDEIKDFNDEIDDFNNDNWWKKFFWCASKR